MIVSPPLNARASAPLNARNFVLAPSDLTFLWDGCKRCFYNKVIHKYAPPRGVFPSIFTQIDSAMKTFYTDCRTDAITPDLPPGKVIYGDSWLETRPINLPGINSTVTLRGKMDTALRFDDGSYGIVDFKTANPKPEFVAFYGRQLHAYAFAAENAAPGKLAFTPVKRLGLIVFEPSRYKQKEDSAYFGGNLNWIEIPRDDEAFLAFLSEVVATLEKPTAPHGATDCTNCDYRDRARRTGL